MVVIDDLQWADDATLSLLAFLAPELERLRIVVSVGVRRAGTGELPAPVRDCLVELGRTDHAVHLTLAGLTPGEVADWIAARTGHVAEQALVDYVADVSRGNPFYVRELLALLESEGRLRGGFEGVPAGVPPAVQ